MDPLGGLNLYIYARNDPTRFVDPNGAAPVDAFVKISGKDFLRFWTGLCTKNVLGI
jgi:hypothetical protein